MSARLINQIKMAREMGDSVVAFYAADTGIEHVLWEMRIEGELDLEGVWTIDINGEDATYEVDVTEAIEEDCEADNFCIKSVGKYREVKRAIEIDF